MNRCVKYIITNTSVRNTFKGKILKPWLTAGYEHLGLWNNGVQTKTSMHRVVATAFIAKPEGTIEVHHKNGIRCDNRAENLEWVSHKGNLDHSLRMGSSKTKLSRADIAEIQRLRTARPVMGLKAIGRKFGITHGHVMMIWRDDNYGHLFAKAA